MTEVRHQPWEWLELAVRRTVGKCARIRALFLVLIVVSCATTPEGGDVSADTVRARRIEIVDDNGTVRMLVSAVPPAWATRPGR